MELVAGGIAVIVLAIILFFVIRTVWIIDMYKAARKAVEDDRTEQEAKKREAHKEALKPKRL